jgi:deoxyribodipyrimidine photo-lyase
MIDKERVQVLSRNPSKKGHYVLYWMQASQRARSNHALEYAVNCANESGQPLIVYFGLSKNYPEANERHYRFLLEGLQEVSQALKERGIAFIIRQESPEKGIVTMAEQASMIVADAGYTRIQRRWRTDAAQHCCCPFIQVESDVVVPVQTASHKQEYSAATVRSKIKEKLPYFMNPLDELRLKFPARSLTFESLDVSKIDALLSSLFPESSAPFVGTFLGGTSEACLRLDDFLNNRLERYHLDKNEPSLDATSNLSPYLHFGQISPLYIALEAKKRFGPGVDAFLEELLIRRELSMNYVYYNENYDSYEGIPAWARRTLDTHRSDRREWTYSLEDLQEGRTHDAYWNAAQREMVLTGKMHGYMRMYWGKKIIEWSPDPAEAFRCALQLNNSYELDGRDPNGFVGVAWCFGAHDRPWQERPIFGNIRYMNAAGLKRKFNIDAYVKKINSLR